MIKVAGCWELGWSAPFSEYDLWFHPLRDYRVDEWIMTPISGLSKKGIVEMEDINSVIDANPDLEVVYIDENGKTELKDFVHPENVLYILGKASYSPMKSIGGGQSIRIETPEQKGLLWPHQTILLVLRHRWLSY